MGVTPVTGVANRMVVASWGRREVGADPMPRTEAEVLPLSSRTLERLAEQGLELRTQIAKVVRDWADGVRAEENLPPPPITLTDNTNHLTYRSPSPHQLRDGGGIARRGQPLNGT